MRKTFLRNLLLKTLAGTLLLSTVASNCSFAFGDGIKKASSPINISVGKEDKFDFQTIQDAINSINVEPTLVNNVTISINPGVYEEVVTIDKPYIKLKNAKGINAEDVIITYDRASGHEDSSKNFGTQKTATVTIDRTATGFSAENITFQNSYNLGENNNREQVQAVALCSIADKVTFDNCRFIGRQDTLFLKGASQGQDVYGKSDTARVYLNNCYIEGTVDYIFGDATAYFQNCKLNVAKANSKNHFTAANTTLFNLGYIFNECTFTVDKSYTQDSSSKIDLGRPWQSEAKYPNYGSQSVFLNCKMPSIINEALFTVWNDETVTNKIRYYYYNLMNDKGLAFDTSKVAKFSKELSEEQVSAYSVSNVLRGNDGWNPLGNNSIKGEVKVCDVTLNEYDFDLPKGEEKVLKAFVLPTNAENKNVKFISENEDIATVSASGTVTAINVGSTNIKAISQESGFYATTKVNVITERTSAPVVNSITIPNDDNIVVGNTLMVNYNYNLESDDEIDCATIKWFAVSPLNNEEILLKEGKSNEARTYTVVDSDKGYNIKVSVVPESLTSYGDTGKITEYTTKSIVEENETTGSVTTYLKEGFDSFFETKYADKNSESYPKDNSYTAKWLGTNSNNKLAWNVIEENGAKAITPNCGEIDDYSLLEYQPYSKEANWENASYQLRMRFNPEIKGLNAEAYFDIYTNYNGKNNSYYKLRFVRGGNTNSLKAYLYKKASSNSKEELIASDEKSLANKVPQNNGQANPWFRIEQTNNNGNITITFKLDNATSNLMTLTASDNSPIKTGYTAIECYGRSNAIVLSNFTVTGVKKQQIDDTNKIRVYLAGDSTVKSYGDDNTIGGWGEFLPYYFDSNKVEVINKAEGGRSTRSYLNQGRLDEILSEIREGDYLFIQFGHNDARTTDEAIVEHSVALGEPDENGIYPTNAAIKTETPQRIVEFYKNTDYPYQSTFYPYESGTFKWYLKQYVLKAREKGAIPILVTPVARVFFDENGKITPHHGENDGYVTAVIQAATETNCTFINMYDITKTMYENYGVKVTQGLQNIKSDGNMDITHYNKFGSNIVTSLLIKALSDENLPLANYTVASSRFVSKTEDLKNATVYLLGDETVGGNMETKNYRISPKGWGDYFSKYFVNQIKVKDLAVEGASSKSFIKTDEYKQFINNLSEGDYVLIQFGLYDCKTDSDDILLYKHTKSGESKDTKDSYLYYIYNYYVKPAIEKKAVAFLVSPLSETETDSEENQKLSIYAEDIRSLASETMSAYVNLYADSKEIFEKKTTEELDGIKPILKNGKYDTERLNDIGARLVAKDIIDMVKYSSATLKSYITDDLYNKASNSNITKADFITMLMDIMQIDSTPSSNFNDVVKGKSYYNAVGNAGQLRIIFGDSDGNFYPEAFLEKNDAIEIIKKALAISNGESGFDFSIFDEMSDIISREDAGKIMALFLRTL